MLTSDDHPLEVWRIKDVADFLRVKPDTVSGYRNRGQMPAPDGRTGGAPWWYAKTVRDWDDQRPRKYKPATTGRPGMQNREGTVQ